MENDNDKRNVILSDIIKGRYCIKDELLYYNEYDNILPDNCKLSNIVYCEIRNIKESSLIKDNKITVMIESDLLVIYEYNSQNDVKNYTLLKDRLKHVIDIEKKIYKMMGSNLNIKALRCHNMVRDIRYATDIDIECKKLIISVTASIESILMEKEIIKLESLSVPIKNTDEINGEKYIPSANIDNIEDKDSLNAYISQLAKLLKRSSEIYNINIELKEAAVSKDKRLNYLENKKRQSDMEYDRLSFDIKNKEAIIEDFKLKLEKSEKKVIILQNANSVMNEDIKTLINEVNDLKSYIEEEDNKKKKQLNYKIKSVIDSMKTLI